MVGVQLMGILLVGTSLKFGKGKGPAKKRRGQMMMMGTVMVGVQLMGMD